MGFIDWTIVACAHGTDVVAAPAPTWRGARPTHEAMCRADLNVRKSGFHRHQTQALFGEELRELGALDLAPMNLAGSLADDVQPKCEFRQIQPDNGQLLSRLHDDPPWAQRLKESPDHTVPPILRRPSEPGAMIAATRCQRHRWVDHTLSEVIKTVVCRLQPPHGDARRAGQHDPVPVVRGRIRHHRRGLGH